LVLKALTQLLACCRLAKQQQQAEAAASSSKQAEAAADVAKVRSSSNLKPLALLYCD
jgi:hypothetical protein